MTPRRLAVKALIHQEQAGYANLVLDAELKKCDPPMNTRDAAFAARIFYTTLERLPLLDYTIDRYTKAGRQTGRPGACRATQRVGPGQVYAGAHVGGGE